MSLPGLSSLLLLFERGGEFLIPEGPGVGLWRLLRVLLVRRTGPMPPLIPSPVNEAGPTSSGECPPAPRLEPASGAGERKASVAPVSGVAWCSEELGEEPTVSWRPLPLRNECCMVQWIFASAQVLP